MMQTLTRLMLPLILLAQVAAGISPGSVLCIAAECCGVNGVEHHEHDDGFHLPEHHHHAHLHLGHGCTQGQHVPCDGHDDGCVLDATISAQAECESHFHVSLPDEAGSSRDRAGERIADIRLFQPALLAPISIDLGAAPSTTVEEPPRGARFATDQCCARKVTRLLI